MGALLLHVIFFVASFTVMFPQVAASSPKLVPEEVMALKKIAAKLGKHDWDFGTDPCTGNGTWNPTVVRKGLQSSVACDCHNTSTCHVVSIDLKSQNLTGVLPSEISNLEFLYHLDLSRNLLTGSVPSQWASMKNLKELSLMGNKLTGPFPIVLTKLTTLTNLSIEGNSFSGAIPSEVGNLINLTKCAFSSNKFSGEIPAQIANLLNLTDLRISDNEFSGKLPEFFSSFTQIQKLHIQGSGFEGPIPSSLFSLKNLTDLRISDLQGNATSTLPSLEAMESLKILSLRNCLIHGSIPKVIGNPSNIKHLDLSFNNLSGSLPLELKQLRKSDFIYLTSNKLTGTVPDWLLSRSSKATDLSNNNFTPDPSIAATCPSESANVVESCSSSKDKSLKLNSCVIRDFPCNMTKKHQRFSLHINCGGDQINGFEGDTNNRGPSAYIDSTYWAFSTTGNIMDNNDDADTYIVTNSTPLLNVSSPSSEIFRTARISPLSLTYYGLCLYNGNYSVTLHFAEIVFADDNTLSSLGRRVFDVYIQDELKLKDFEIAKEAGGAGRLLNKTFDVSVKSNKLKIHLYWAGKGTTGIPLRGNYGPLISAISVEPNFKPPVFTDSKTRILRIAIGAAVGLFSLVILLVGYLLHKIKGRKHEDQELRGLDLQTGIFTHRQLKAATKNFDAANKLGEGGFGAVYKGLLSDGTTIAVKQLSTRSKQGNREFINEIGMISALQHPNLVKLYGCCVEGHQLMLVYEYMENNCLSRALFGKHGAGKLALDWPTRRRICIDVARGLAYLHEESIIKIVHRDIKTSNVLLDKKLNAKISDFGLAKLNDGDKSHISTRIAGTIGYMSPEYAMRGYLTDKADVYSFGVVALEVVSGKSNTNFRPKDEFVYLLDWANVLHERGNLVELVDPELKSEYVLEEVIAMLNVALLCTNASPTLRPSMSEVVSILEGKSTVRDLASDVSRSRDSKKHFWQNPSATNSAAVIGYSVTSSYVETDVSDQHMEIDSMKDEELSDPYVFR